MKFRGTLAQAAPSELAALMAENLIAERKEDDPLRRRDREEPFQFLDHGFSRQHLPLRDHSSICLPTHRTRALHSSESSRTTRFSSACADEIPATTGLDPV